jgi:acetylornithine aminotransferase
MRIVAEDKLLDNAALVGERIKSGLQREWSGIQGVVEIRGQGLMLGIELDRPCGDLLNKAADAGLLISITADTVIRLLPPLIMTPAEGDEVVRILAPLVREFLAAKA